MKNFQVAIDGPAGSGKSSISNIIASKLNFTHIDTGAMYRAVTLEALNRKINLDNEMEYDFLDEIKITYNHGKTYLNGKDVSNLIRTPEISSNVSTVAKLKSVREKMVYFQQESAKVGNVLMDGRDIGSVVLPNAQVKIFLTASVLERAKRRMLELNASGEHAELEEIKKAIEERDYKDSHREISPLVKAKDAIEVDTTSMTIEEVCNKIIGIISERMSENMEKEFSMDDLNFDLPKVGDKVKGEVVSVSPRTIMINFGSITEGTMHLDHYTLDKNATSFEGLVKVGDVIEAEVTKVSESEYGTQILLSRLGNAKKEAFQNFVNENDNKPITVTVTGRVKAGYMTSYKGVSFFLHESEASDLKKGDKVKVLITNLDEERGSGRVSIKALERAEEYAAKAAEFEALKVGDVINGVISKIEPYGVFLEFGNLHGLVRLKEISHVYVENPTSLFKIGDKKEAKIISLDKGKIDLSFKALTKSPIELFAETNKVSDKIEVKVLNKLPFGVVCEVAPNVTGLLHKSEFSWNPNDNLLASIKIGDKLEVAIIALDVENNKVSLSKKALIDNPWGRVEAHPGDVIDCKVTEVTPKGLKIEALGVDGFIDARDIKLDKGSNKLSDYYNQGDTLKAIITKIDPKSWILNASIKSLQEQEERAQFEKFMETEKEDETPITIGDVIKK